MAWIPYTKAIYENLTGYPKVGDKVLYQAKRGKDPVCYQATITKVLDLRRYVVRYPVPEGVKNHFLNGTTSAITKIENLSFFCTTVIHENKE